MGPLSVSVSNHHHHRLAALVVGLGTLELDARRIAETVAQRMSHASGVGTDARVASIGARAKWHWLGDGLSLPQAPAVRNTNTYTSFVRASAKDLACPSSSVRLRLQLHLAVTGVR